MTNGMCNSIYFVYAAPAESKNKYILIELPHCSELICELVLNISDISVKCYYWKDNIQNQQGKTEQKRNLNRI